jgi:DNA-binding response OmpR family regulator
MARILIVDDEKPLADTLATILRLKQYEVEVAYDGVEGITAAQRFHPDLIVSDVAMPKRNGVEMAIALTQSIPQTKILLVSGQAVTTGLLQEARARGYDFECLAKPLHPVDLLNRIALLLSASSSAQAS